jgi:hypothetical protein
MAQAVMKSNWDEYGKTEWIDGEINSPTLSLIPYVPYFFGIAA